MAAIDDVTASAEMPTPASGTATTKQIRGSSLLLGGRLIALVVNLLVQVLIVRSLSQTEFGAFAYALSLVTLCETIVTFGLDRGLGRFLAVYDERRDDRRILGTLVMVLATVLGLGLALVLVVVGFRGALLGVGVANTEAAALLAILIVLAPIQALDNLLGGALAVFANARSIFVRKYVVGPGLRLAVVLLLVAGGFGAEFLAVGYVLTGLVGVMLYGALLLRVLRARGILAAVRWRDALIPGREILVFTIPLLTTDLVYIALQTTDALILGHFWGAQAVAEYRVIQPLVNLNLIVYSSFTILYLPAASRLFARGERDGVAQLYWRTAIWMAVVSFPIFALTTSLAEPVTVALFEERYAGSATYLAILSLAAYLNVALGFNGLTLRVYGLVRYTVAINLIAAAASVALNLALIPVWGPLGAAVATAIALIGFNLLKQAGLRRGTGISTFDRRYAWVYGVIALATVAIGAVQLTLRPSLVPSLLLAAFASAVVLVSTRRALDVAGMFPEVLRLPFGRRIFGV